MTPKLIPLSQLKYHWIVYLFALPSLALIALFMYYPVATGAYHSFFRWNGGDINEPIGLQNYTTLIKKPEFWASFRVALILGVWNIVKMIPALAAAVCINRVISGRKQFLYRVLFVAPMVVPGLVLALVWRTFFFDATMGYLNRSLLWSGLYYLLVGFTNFFGLTDIFTFDSGPPAWLGDGRLIIFSCIVWGFPWTASFAVLTHFAKLQGIPRELTEAAELDGADWWTKFTKLELPLIRSSINILVVLVVIETFKDATIIYALAGATGGPGGKAMVPLLFMMQEAFMNQQMGSACAVGIVLVIIVLVIQKLLNTAMNWHELSPKEKFAMRLLGAALAWFFDIYMESPFLVFIMAAAIFPWAGLLQCWHSARTPLLEKETSDHSSLSNSSPAPKGPTPIARGDRREPLVNGPINTPSPNGAIEPTHTRAPKKKISTNPYHPRLLWKLILAAIILAAALSAHYLGLAAILSAKIGYPLPSPFFIGLALLAVLPWAALANRIQGVFTRDRWVIPADPWAPTPKQLAAQNAHRTLLESPSYQTKERLKSLWLRFCKHGLIWFILLFAYLPLILMVIVSFKTNAQYNKDPAMVTTPLHPHNWSAAWRLVAPSVANSIFITVISTALTLFLALGAAYFFARVKMPGSNFLWWSIVILLTMPTMASMAPLYILLKNMNLLNTLTCLIAVGSAGGQMFAIFVLRRFIADLPEDLFEAAEIDGASHLRQMLTIVAPLSGPILGVVGLMHAVGQWNDFLFPLIFMTDEDRLPVMVQLSRMNGDYVKEFGPLMAGYLMAAIPVILLFTACMRLFTRGLTEGALKG